MRVVRKPGVVFTRTGDQALLVDDEGGNVHVVNESAARVWELCESSPTVEEIVSRFADAYGKDADTVGADVDGILKTFRDLDLVELSESQ